MFLIVVRTLILLFKVAAQLVDDDYKGVYMQTKAFEFFASGPKYIDLKTKLVEYII